MAILALDQGTTSSRCIVYDDAGGILGKAQQEFPQHFPRPGRVEHDPEDILASQLDTLHSALRAAAIGLDQVAAVGISNQRETVVVWDRATGAAQRPAIVWQDRRTSRRCAELIEQGHQELVRERTGLYIDPYFSATKLAWILDQDAGLRRRAEAGELLAGTVDSWLTWRLTDGQAHVTDVSNAARTMLMDLATGTWDDELCALFGVPPAMLPRIVPSAGVIADGRLDGHPLPIRALVGDQQAALFGQGCLRPGMAKNTYGTGAFAMVHCGTHRPLRNGALTTVAWQIGDRPTEYAVEGSVLVAGAAVQWLRDGLHLIDDAAASEALASSVADSAGVVVVPALAGLATPHWDPQTRGTVLGLTRGASDAHLVRATLEGIAHSVTDAVAAICDGRPHCLRVDGGMSANDLLLQLQADRLGCPVERPVDIETTARGAAALAAVGAGLLTPAETADWWRLDHRVEPAWDARRRGRASRRWARAVAVARSWCMEEDRESADGC